MKILLMTPTWPIELRTHKKLRKVTTETELLGIAYLASYLRHHGYQVEVLDFFVGQVTDDDLTEYMRGRSYDLVGITVFTPSVECVKRDVKALRECFPSAAIGIGGPHVTSMQKINRAQEILTEMPEIDFAVFGEGEETLLDIARRVEKGSRDFSSIHGVVCKIKDQFVVNKPRELIDDIDNIPFPAYDLLPLDKYKRTPSSYKREPVRSVLFSRGCPFCCVFCDRGAFGHRVRRRSISNIYDELVLLTEKYKTREIRIWDDVFTLDKRFVFDFCEVVEPFDLLWTCNARVNLITPEQARKMKSAGCWAVDFGIESGNNSILEFINKSFTVEQAKESIRVAKEAGIEVRAFFILGFPGETEETVGETIRFALENDIDYATFYLPQPYPGTELYEIAVKEGALNFESWNDFLIEGSTPTYINPNFTAEQLTMFQTQAYKRFYKRISYFWKHLRKIKNLEDVKRYARALPILKF